MKKLIIVCFTVSLICIIAAVVSSLMLIWGSDKPDVLWRSFASIGIFSLASVLTIGVTALVGDRLTTHSGLALWQPVTDAVLPRLRTVRHWPTGLALRLCPCRVCLPLDCLAIAPANRYTLPTARRSLALARGRANVAQGQSSGFVNQWKRHSELENGGLVVWLGVFGREIPRLGAGCRALAGVAGAYQAGNCGLSEGPQINKVRIP